MLILVQLITAVIGLYSLCLIAWLILSMLISFNVVNRQQRAVMLSMYYLNRLCGPPLRHIRRYLPNTGQIDIAPIVLLLLLGFAQDVLVCLVLGQNPLLAVVRLLASLIQFYIYALIIQMVISLLISFGIINRFQPVVSAINYTLERLTEPALAPIRRILPPIGMIDFSPMVLILVLGFLKNAMFNAMFHL